MFVRFLHCKVTLSSLFILYSLEDIVMHNPHWRNGELWSISEQVQYLHKLFGILLHVKFVSFPCIYLSNHLLISIWTNGYIYIYNLYFGLYLILFLNFVAQLVLPFPMSFFNLAPISFWKILIIVDFFFFFWALPYFLELQDAPSPLLRG